MAERVVGSGFIGYGHRDAADELKDLIADGVSTFGGESESQTRLADCKLMIGGPLVFQDVGACAAIGSHVSVANKCMLFRIGRFGACFPACVCARAHTMSPPRRARVMSDSLYRFSCSLCRSDVAEERKAPDLHAIAAEQAR
jgi:hypothetical protein